jgi:hypothetical protein
MVRETDVLRRRFGHNAILPLRAAAVQTPALTAFVGKIGEPGASA